MASASAGADSAAGASVASATADASAFSAGAGFSSADALLFNARVSEQNLFGRGQRLIFNADIGSIRQNFQISFTEPWFLNRPLAVGVDLFDWRLEFDRFTRGATGFALRASYPLQELGLGSLYGLSLNRVRAGLEYRLENARIDGVSQSAPPDVKDEEGTRLTSSVTPSLSRNTLNHAFDPTGGWTAARGDHHGAGPHLPGRRGQGHAADLGPAVVTLPRATRSPRPCPHTPKNDRTVSMTRSTSASLRSANSGNDSSWA